MRARANDLVDELRSATEEVLALVGPRAVVVEQSNPGPVIDERYHRKWQLPSIGSGRLGGLD
jgi:hypothetical protein